MAEEVQITATPAPAADISPSVAPVSAPAESATPSATPSTPDIAPAPEVTTSEPVTVEPTPAPEPAAPTTDSSKPATPTTPAAPSLLSEQDAPAAETPAPDAETKETEPQSTEPAPLPTYEPFKLPEQFNGEIGPQLKEFTNSLAEFEKASNASHAEVQKLGQALLDKHLSEMAVALQTQKQLIEQEKIDRRTEWYNQFKADPELGGKRFDTSIAEAKEFIKTHGGDAAQVSAFYKALDETGAAAHPDVVRFILNVKNSSGFRAPLQLAANKPYVENKSKVFKRYGTN